MATGESDGRALQELRVGDPVLVADDPSLSGWSERPIRFSAGVGELSADQRLVEVTYSDGERLDTLLVGRHQLFLLDDGRVKPASTLVPGADLLMGRDRSPRRVLALEVGHYRQALHQVATSEEPSTDLEGHLLVAKEVVIGDYALLLGLATAESHPEWARGFEELPEVGTPAYAEAYSDLETSSSHSAIPGYHRPASREDRFEPLRNAAPVEIPRGAPSYFTARQSRDLESAPAAPSVSATSAAMVHSLFRSFRGHYPTIRFVFDPADDRPTVYTFQDTVVVTGGLVRIEAVKRQNLTLMLAHSVGRFIGGAPRDTSGLSCTGVADYAVSSVLVTVFGMTHGRKTLRGGSRKLERLFHFISEENRKGKPGDTCDHISLNCRLRAMGAGYEVHPLPACAGGTAPPVEHFVVRGASGSIDPDGISATVYFNLEVDPTTGQELGNYAFAPLAETFSARIPPGDSKAVVIEGEFVPGTEYTVTVSAVESADKKALGKGENHAEFFFPYPGAGDD